MSVTQRKRVRREIDNLLERRGVLPPADTTRAIEGADSAAGVAVPAAVCHALGAGVRVDILAIVVRAAWNRGNRHRSLRRGGRLVIHGGSDVVGGRRTTIATGLAGDVLVRVGAGVLAAKGVDGGERRRLRKLRWLLGQLGGLALLPQELLLGERLLLLAHLSTRCAAAGKTGVRFLAAQEGETGAARLCGLLLRVLGLSSRLVGGGGSRHYERGLRSGARTSRAQGRLVSTELSLLHGPDVLACQFGVTHT